MCIFVKSTHQRFPVMGIYGLFLSLLVAISCPEETALEIEGEIYLSVENTRCQSVYLNVSIPDSGCEKIYSLYRDNHYVGTDTLYGSDTLIMDSGLQPSTDYLYQALYVYRGDIIDSSNVVCARTMDITSSNFIWHVDTIADYPSVLRDVAVINDDDIWAVGELKMTGGPYNAVHWDGEVWTYYKVPTISYPNQSIIGSADLKTVYAISSSEVYFCAGASFTKWSGEEFIPLDMFMEYEGDPDYGPLWRMWSENGDDIYLVGYKGYSVHYDGSSWEKLETGTSIFLRDISGKGDHVFATGYNDSGESIALELVDGKWQTLFESDNYYADWGNGEFGWATAVDVFGDTLYVLTSTGIVKRLVSGGDFIFMPANTVNMEPRKYGYCVITHQDINDIFIGSRHGQCLHFNGRSWKNLSNILVEDRVFYYGAFKNNTVALIGSFHYYGALIARGVR